ncbi:MAG: PEGA domain-containing protein, partial [Gemmatimonadaceae bacterium]
IAAATAAAGALVVMSACATIVHGSKQAVTITSTPPSAAVTVDGVASGTTPVTLRLARKTAHVVRLQLAGYAPHEATLERGTSGWVWGNLVFGGLIGVIIDASNGAMYKLSPAELSATLTRVTSSTDASTFHVAVVMRAEPDWQKIGQLTKTQ